ncbi:MAG TPA: ankyrin repeat domain-containing protein [Bryobacteraceae bacterium]|jgi:ankyrin repeat protein
MSFKHCIFATVCAAAVLAPVWAQAQKQSVADLMEAGNRKAALERIRAGADVNEAQPEGTRPLHWAIYQVDYELLDALIAKKANVNVLNEFGSSPLAEAVKLSDARMVKTLLDAGAKVETSNPDGETPLMLAIKTGELPVVEMLIKAGANVNARETFHQQTALMWAAASTRNAAEMVKSLLAKGADVKPRSLFSDWSSQISSEPRAQYRPTGGLTAMLYAARDGCPACVEELAAAGADVNQPTPEGVTALMLAIDNDHNDTAMTLLGRGANAKVWDWWGRTALYIAIDRKASAGGGGGRGGAGSGGGRGAARAAGGPRGAGRTASSMDIVNALLEAGVDPNIDLNMHRPSRGGNSGRFVEEQLNTGCTPLFRAVQANDVEVVKALLAKGADPNINTMGMTAFLAAAGVGPGSRGGTGLAAQGAAGGNGNVSIMEALLQHGADINARVDGTKTYSMRVSRAPSANEGMSALHVAAQGGRLDLVKYLLDKGAKPDVLNDEGKRPIDLIPAVSARAGGTPAAGSGAAVAPPQATGNAGAAAGGRGAASAAGGGPAGPNPATLAEIHTLLQNASTK